VVVCRKLELPAPQLFKPTTPLVLDVKGYCQTVCANVIVSRYIIVEVIHIVRLS